MLGKHEIISNDLARRLSKMARFRNRIVHLYWEIDYDQIYEFLLHNLDDLEQYSKQIVENFLD